MPVDPEKLAKLQKSSAKKVGGSRVKAKKGVKTEQDDTKLIEALGKLKATKIEGVEEANFFKEDGKVLHFNRVGVQGAATSNTFAFTGYPQEKNITQLIPQILPQLGAENLEILRQLAEQIQAGKTPKDLGAGTATAGSEAEGSEDIPDLVDQKFDDVE
ncbi:EGD1 [Candida pseudojiufengensis]|uniref:EGD1 n=1 Tax=Candida pseudojiufengensis TaxID=497109 RepID=UPI0022257A5F|nr:EGD1 [Candida pseudojiufengensis]KAI5963800.1 EGD1 [Candida pseudojiufengensis]